MNLEVFLLFVIKGHKNGAVHLYKFHCLAEHVLDLKGKGLLIYEKIIDFILSSKFRNEF